VLPSLKQKNQGSSVKKKPHKNIFDQLVMDNQYNMNERQPVDHRTMRSISALQSELSSN